MDDNDSTLKLQEFLLKVIQYNKGLIDLDQLMKEVNEKASASKNKLTCQPWIKGLDFLECYKTKLSILEHLCNASMLIIIECLTSKSSEEIPKLSFMLEVKSSDTVEAVKAKIKEIKGTPPVQQRLFLKGNPLKDGRTMKEYNIKTGTLIRLERTFQIFVHSLNGFVHNCEVEESDTIEMIKTYIEKKLYIPVDEQRIIYKGLQLRGELTVSDYKLQAGSHIHIVLQLRGS